MRPLRATEIYLRRLLAVLAVLAAFAFQARVGGMVGLRMPGMSGMAQVVGHNMARTTAGPSSAATVPVPQPQPGQGDRESHNHAAHCPFCVTGAFALEAGVLPLPTAPPRLAPHTWIFAPADLPTATRHADARAPPVLL